MVFCLYDNMLAFKISWEKRDVLSSYTSIRMPQTCHYMSTTCQLLQMNRKTEFQETVKIVRAVYLGIKTDLFTKMRTYFQKHS